MSLARSTVNPPLRLWRGPASSRCCSCPGRSVPELGAPRDRRLPTRRRSGRPGRSRPRRSARRFDHGAQTRAAVAETGAIPSTRPRFATRSAALRARLAAGAPRQMVQIDAPGRHASRDDAGSCAAAQHAGTLEVRQAMPASAYRQRPVAQCGGVGARQHNRRRRRHSCARPACAKLPGPGPRAGPAAPCSTRLRPPGRAGKMRTARSGCATRAVTAGRHGRRRARACQAADLARPLAELADHGWRVNDPGAEGRSDLHPHTRRHEQ